MTCLYCFTGSVKLSLSLKQNVPDGKSAGKPVIRELHSLTSTSGPFSKASI